MKTLIVSGDIGEFKQGEELTRAPAIAAYIRSVMNEGADKETTLSNAEIMNTFDRFRSDATDPADIEIELISELIDRESGKDDDDDATISIEAATARQSSAFTLGTKLNGKFNHDLVEVLDAGDTIKKGPFVLMYDVRDRWSKEEIMEFPRMGSKLDRADKDNVELSNKTYDFYTTVAGSEKIASSWCEDIIRATKEGRRIVDVIEALQTKSAEAPDNSLAKTQAQECIKLERKRIKDASTLLRKAIILSIVLWRLEDGCPKLEIEVQRDADGIPLRTQYPVIIEQRNLKSSRRAVTLSQVLSLHKQSISIENGKAVLLDGVDKAIAGGGTMDALNKAFPTKKPKTPTGLKIGDVNTAYDAVFALRTFFEKGGAAAYAKQLNGPRAEEYICQLGDLYSSIGPLYDTIHDRYTALNATPAKRKA